jgi:hypothetical protein
MEITKKLALASLLIVFMHCQARAFSTGLPLTEMSPGATAQTDADQFFDSIGYDPLFDIIALKLW